MLPRSETVLDESGGDDSVFVSLADLFSLLSITVIYVVLTFGQTVPISSEPVVAVKLEGTGPGRPVSPDDTYVSIQDLGTFALFRINRNGNQFDQMVSLDATAPKLPEQWLLTTLAQVAGSGIVFIYLPPEVNSPAIKLLFLDMVRLIKPKFPSVNVAL